MDMLLIVSILVVLVYSTEQVNITIGLFHNDIIPDLFLNRTLQQTISQYNVKFDVRKFNTSSMTSKSIEILNINGFERMSFIIDTAVRSKVPKGAARILHVPLIETGSLLHFKTIPNRDDSGNRNELSMIPDAHYRSTVAAKFLHMLSWTHVVVVFQVKRINDLDHFIRSFDKGTVLAILPVEENLNGSITHHSVARIKSLATGNFSAVLLIYDEAGLPELFQLIRSDDVDLCSVRINILLLDLIFRDKLNVCNLHTVVGLQVQMNGSSEGSTHRSHLEVLGADPTLGNLLLYDALNLVANITSNLASSDRWLSLSRDEKGIIQSIRIANTANFTAALQQGKFDGASGNIEFNANRTRVNMPLNLVNVKKNNLVKIGTATENTDIELVKNPRMNIEYHLDSILINDHIKVVTAETEPFTFVTKNPNGTVSYSGLCIDILNKLAQMMNFTYSIYLVEDGEYGRKDGDKWTGMIGDVLYKASSFINFFIIA
ncbi:glutamate receptor ionotropic, NMDA 1-like [Rhopilema esculentum]|uniref:glutamate receptor ionotropic, NMDA 1-like n=1 Tax=Rhopilema esculentum TaxID=499914 RepID=UPI0031E213AF